MATDVTSGSAAHARAWAARAFIVAALTFAAAQVQATPGRVDANGCHASKTIGFHCHPERASGSAVGSETTRERERRLKRECKGRPNAGACLGFGG